MSYTKLLFTYRTWVDNLPFEIPFGFATTFKSDEDWLDDWEEVDDKPRSRKPYTFDDRVNDYRYDMFYWRQSKLFDRCCFAKLFQL